MLGMMLGNCTSGVSLGLTTVLDELTTRELQAAEVAWIIMRHMAMRPHAPMQPCIPELRAWEVTLTGPETCEFVVKVHGAPKRRMGRARKPASTKLQNKQANQFLFTKDDTINLLLLPKQCHSE